MEPKQRRWQKSVAYVQIAAQVGAALLPFYVGSAHAADAAVGVEIPVTETQNDKLKQNLAEQLSAFGDSAASGNAVGAVAQQVGSGFTTAAQDWLKRFGTARIDLNYTDKFNIDSGSIDMLLPLADSESRLLFTQVGVRKKYAQITGNVGIGQRHFTDDWMFGYNAFYDQNITRGHQRAGIGAEAWRDYLKLSANSYLRISDWKASPDVIDYDERPATGFDLRAEAWLPSMPSLGGKLMYEQYFGSDVGLAGIGNRQSNPKAVTFGLNYTPIPMLTLGLDHRRGGGTGDTKIALQFNYALGQSWSSQADASRVAQRRSVAGSRYDLVERNNNIVLEYRKQQLVKLQLPKEIVGKSNKTIPITYTLEAKNGLRHIEWQHAELTVAGGAVTHSGSNQFQLTLPAYVPGASNAYPISAVATDTKGNTGSASSVIRVDAPDASAKTSLVTATPTTILADGKSVSLIKIELRDDDDDAIPGVTADLSAPLTETPQAGQAATRKQPLQLATISTLRETTAGVYEAVVTAGTRVGSLQIAPAYKELALSPITIAIGADSASAHIGDNAMLVVVDNAIANQAATNRVTAIVTDAGGNPLVDLPVTFALSGSAKVAAGSSLTPVTDAMGAVAINFSDAVAESMTITATLANGNSAKVAAQFIADNGSAQIGSNDLSVDKVTVIANSTDAAAFSAIVKDANGNPVPNISVGWATNLGHLSDAGSSTGPDGRATVMLTGATAGPAQVTAKVGANAAVKAPVVTFTADGSSGGIGSGDLSVDKTAVVANNTDAAIFSAIVKDASGNPLQDITVIWTTNLGSLSTASSNTDAHGLATMRLTGTVAGTAQVTARLATSAAINAPAVTFIGDSSSGGIGSGDLTVDKTNVIANSTDAATFSAIVKDSNGNLLPGISVSWATDHGNLSAVGSSTDTNGRATIRLTGAIAGTAQVTGKVATAAAANAPVVTFTPDSSSGNIGAGDLTVNKTSVVANNTDAAVFNAIVKDAGGNLVPNVNVSWTTDHGNLSAAGSSTDANGRATTHLTGTIAGKAQVTAKVKTSAAANAPVVTFIADGSSGNIGAGDLTVDKTTVVANNTDAAVFSAVIKDAHGNPVPDISVAWTTNRGTLSMANTTTDSTGRATVGLTGTVAGAAQVSAVVSSNPAVNAESVNFIADLNTARFAETTSDKVRITGTGVETATISATLVDANDNPLIDQAVAWATSTGGLDGMTSTTDVYGVATIKLSAPVLRATTDGTAVVTVNFGSATRQQNVDIRAVWNVSGRDFWTMLRDHPTTNEASASDHCAEFGGGTVVTLQQRDTLIVPVYADIRTMSVPGEFLFAWYRLGNTWNTSSGDFEPYSGYGTSVAANGSDRYVCIK